MGDKIYNTDAVLCHMSRLTLRVEYTKLHYYRLRFVHVTVWKNLKTIVGLNFVQICIEVMVVRVGHGKLEITEILNRVRLTRPGPHSGSDQIAFI